MYIINKKNSMANTQTRTGNNKWQCRTKRPHIVRNLLILYCWLYTNEIELKVNILSHVKFNDCNFSIPLPKLRIFLANYLRLEQLRKMDDFHVKRSSNLFFSDQLRIHIDSIAFECVVPISTIPGCMCALYFSSVLFGRFVHTI